jgi:hypothetical protein
MLCLGMMLSMMVRPLAAKPSDARRDLEKNSEDFIGSAESEEEEGSSYNKQRAKHILRIAILTGTAIMVVCVGGAAMVGGVQGLKNVPRDISLITGAFFRNRYVTNPLVAIGSVAVVLGIGFRLDKAKDTVINAF